jgi:predicted NAD-dependent protein-ADP-ribosyltransferase YbiA (DUF1768 family)
MPTDDHVVTACIRPPHQNSSRSVNSRMNAFLSNKLIHKFIDQYHNYNFTEQFMQAAKAMLYNNFESHDAIIAEEDPNELTRLGDKIEIHGSRPYTAAWEESNSKHTLRIETQDLTCSR